METTLPTLRKIWILAHSLFHAKRALPETGRVPCGAALHTLCAPAQHSGRGPSRTKLLPGLGSSRSRHNSSPRRSTITIWRSTPRHCGQRQKAATTKQATSNRGTKILPAQMHTQTILAGSVKDFELRFPASATRIAAESEMGVPDQLSEHFISPRFRRGATSCLFRSRSRISGCGQRCRVDSGWIGRCGGAGHVSADQVICKSDDARGRQKDDANTHPDPAVIALLSVRRAHGIMVRLVHFKPRLYEFRSH